VILSIAADDHTAINNDFRTVTKRALPEAMYWASPLWVKSGHSS